MSRSKHIAIIIPAAGASERFGAPKQLLKWGHTTLLTHSVQTAQQLNCDEVIVVLGANFSKIKQTIDNYPVVILYNEQWESGFGNSIAFGVTHILNTDPEIDAALIMLPDQPLIDATYLNEMLENFEPGIGQILATEYDRQKPGVPAIFDKTYFQELSKLNDDTGARSIIMKHSTHVSMHFAEGKLGDIDTEAEYKALYNANHQ